MDLITILLIAMLVGMSASVPVILILLVTLTNTIGTIKKEVEREEGSYAIPLSALRGMPMGMPPMGPDDMKKAYAAYMEATGGKPEDTKDAAHAGTYL